MADEEQTTEVPATPTAKALALGEGIDLSQIQGTGPGGKITKADVQAALPPNATETAAAHAAELGVDLRSIKGTGADGRITKADVEAAVAAHPELAGSVNTASTETVVPVTATVLQDYTTGLWTVDVSIAHPDQTIVRVNGRGVWQGTP